MARSLAVAAGIAAIGLGTYACAKSSGGVSVSNAELAALPAPKSTGKFALGINEALAVPSKKRSQLSQSELQSQLDADAAKVRDLGATWVRGHTGNFPQISCSVLKSDPSKISDMDAWVTALGSDLDGLAMLSPWPGNQTAAYTQNYLPSDMDAYRQCIEDIVERYDGDGKSDMPGLKNPIKYWEIDNEPDLKNSGQAKGTKRDYDPATFATPSEYAKVVIATSKAIRKADSGAHILACGLYRPHATSGQEYLAAVLENENVKDAFDILSLHTYNDDDGEKLATGIEASRLLLPDKPVWVTETSVTSADGEDTQARRVAALTAQSALAGAERVFWHTLADPASSKTVTHFSTNSLMKATSETSADDKPAAKVFRNLAKKLASDDLVGAVADGDGAVKLKSGAILLYSGERTAKHGGTNLQTSGLIADGGTASAPAWLDAK